MTNSHKFFQIGFSKCGTTSIAHFFNANGISCVHYDGGRLAKRMQLNLQENRFILSGYEHYDAFADMLFLSAHEIIEGYKYYRQILEQVESAKFILNTRNIDNWIRSILNHSHPKDMTLSYVERYKSARGLETESVSAVVERWKKEWYAHHATVQEQIPSEKLLVFDIEMDSPLRLCEFVGLDASAARHYMHKNFTLNSIGKFLVSRTPQPFFRMVPKKLKGRIKWLLRKNR